MIKIISEPEGEAPDQTNSDSDSMEYTMENVRKLMPPCKYCGRMVSLWEATKNEFYIKHTCEKIKFPLITPSEWYEMMRPDKNATQLKLI
jgi:hypothetical protein